ncbi:hypothetical protein [Noviherbaspirillum suwonense]|uniref:Uncharacterized protein n=1 Tax=Noviherbaspirillum suwonense TaxID=1224511 RepID=A0ABY1QJ40_9BURK|nr:hypothetical protein [Noviherbaspirillum suwonense]SMP72763.1 hypothetical protein SAMN06295970_118107 [Noviherbaspirillum suwonense]
MSYRIYLQIPNGSAFERTETGSRSIAESVFRAFLERDELDNKDVSLHLVYQRTTLAVHRFNEAASATNNWKGRVDEIAWPVGHGHVGRPTELEGGGRRNVYLDAVSIARAKKLGKGNISEGIRIALSRV